MSQYITTTGLKNTMQSFLNKLKEWLPIKKTEESVIIQAPEKAPEAFKNSIEIKSDGMIYIIGTNQDQIQLQSRLDKIGTIIVDSSDDALSYLSEEYLGSLIYIKEGDSVYTAGLYTISINASLHGELMLVKLGTTTSSDVDLGERVDAIEQWIDKPLNTDEIDILTDDDPDNDTLINN